MFRKTPEYLGEPDLKHGLFGKEGLLLILGACLHSAFKWPNWSIQWRKVIQWMTTGQPEDADLFLNLVPGVAFWNVAPFPFTYCRYCLNKIHIIWTPSHFNHTFFFWMFVCLFFATWSLGSSDAISGYNNSTRELGKCLQSCFVRLLYNYHFMTARVFFIKLAGCLYFTWCLGSVYCSSFKM